MADSAGDRTTAPQPLDGVLVADFSRVLAGPLATMTLGDLGADVIKIERPGKGDDTRSWGPPFTAAGDSAYYLSVNRNKRSIALDLADVDERAVATQIAQRADIVVENYRAGTMERFGLGYESLAADNPGLVYCRVSGFGGGAGRDLPGYDFLVQALSGFMSITGDADGPPTKTGVAIIDVLTGLNASVGILAALIERQRSGRGQYLEVNLLSSALAGLVNQASSFLNTEAVPTRMGNQHPNIAPYETFATATVPIVVAVGNDAQFRNLCEALERPDVAADARWTTNAGRVEQRSALIAELEATLIDRPAAEWLDTLRSRGVTAGPVNDIGEAFELANRLELDPVQELARADGTVAATVSNPVVYSRTPVSYRMAPPALGADTAEVLAWLDELAPGRA